MKGPEKLPTPWLDDPTAQYPAELRAALREARAEEPDPQRIARVALALGLPPEGPGGGTGAPPPVEDLAASGAPSAAKLAAPWVKWAAVAVLAIGGTWLGLGAGAPAKPPHVVTSNAPQKLRAAMGAPHVTPLSPLGAPAPETPVGTARSPAPEVTLDTAPRADAPRRVVRRSQRRTAPRPERTTRPTTGQPSELELLERASVQLTTKPRAALATARLAGEVYPHGTFVQERQLVEVQALVKLHEDARALEAATAFLRAHPGSPYRDRVLELHQLALAAQADAR